jgi:hypothetical protein
MVRCGASGRKSTRLSRRQCRAFAFSAVDLLNESFRLHPQAHAAGHLKPLWGHCGVLCSSVHVTEAALKRVLLKDGVRPSEVVDDVHGLRGAHASVDAPSRMSRSG